MIDPKNFDQRNQLHFSLDTALPEANDDIEALFDYVDTLEAEADALKRQLLCPATGKTWEWHYKALVADFVDDSSEESLNENAVAKLQVALEEARLEVERLREAAQVFLMVVEYDGKLPIREYQHLVHVAIIRFKAALTQSGGV